MPLSRKTPGCVRELLQEMGEPALASFSSALIPGLSRPLLGVRIPRLRTLARELAKTAPAEVLVSLPAADATFEEVMLYGFVLGYARLPWEEQWVHIEAFVPYMDNWALCDSCCATFTAVRKHRDEAWQALRPYAESAEEFHQRFAAIMMLDHFLCDDYIENVLNRLAAIRPAGYYATMGVGWALSVCYVKYPALTLPYLTDNNVSAEVRRTACRKILESRRTPADCRPLIKNIIRTIDRKI